ncbi:MAG: hypothetical protein F4X59_17570 [Holophagales bacterium]|nr:hypothetical protein [Holophagales bacterium]MYC11916.1 hypothetical protein [Holophagales bacterium]
MKALKLISAIWRTVNSMEWQSAGYDAELHTEMMALAVADELDGGRAPTPEAMRSALNRGRRDTRIRKQRDDGAKLSVLAKRHGLSVRQVRRIVKRV